MAESLLEQNVIIEVAEVVDSDDINTQVQTGTVTHTVFTGCEDSAHNDIAFNAPYTRTAYQGDEVVHLLSGLYYDAIGCAAGGVTTSSLVASAHGLHLWPCNSPIPNKLITMKLGKDGVPANFHWLNTRISRNGPSGDLYWDANNSQDQDINVQGRNLYMEDNTSSPTLTYCWEVYDRDYREDELILKGNGIDPQSEIHTLLCPPLEQNGDGALDWYISPWVHSYQWSSREPQFKWESENRGTYMSYGGARDTASYYINECWQEDSGMLALRSDDFYYNRFTGAGKNVLDCWELEINVASITNAKIEIFEGTPVNSNITQTNPGDITSSGIYTFCLAALQPGISNSLGCASEGPTIVPLDPEEKYEPFDNQVNVLNAKKINQNLGASVIINSIKLTKKNPGFWTYDEPIYEYSVAYTVDRYNWNYLDLKESEAVPLSLNFSVGDLKDISKRTAGYSKTFMLPANKHNNEVLTPMLAVGAERVMIHWMKARIKCNGVNIFAGLMRVEEGNTGKGGFYKCHIIEDTIDWSQAIGDDTLCDIALVGPGGITPPELKTFTSVVNSWDDTVDTSDFIYGLVNYGEWQAQSVNTGTTHDYNHNSEDFHPTVFAKAITDKIFASKGYTIQSNFFNSATFKKLCHPWVSGESYMDENLFDSGGSQASHVELTTKTTAGGNFSSGGKIPAAGLGFIDRHWYPNLVPGSDVGNNWTTNASGGGYIAPFTGTYEGFMDATLYISQNYFAWWSEFCIELRVNGALHTFTGGHSVVNDNIERDPGATNTFVAECCVAKTDSGVHNGINRFIEFNIDLQAGDNVSMRLRATNGSTLYAAWMDASHMNIDIYPVPSSTIPDKLVNLSKILPCMKQMEYLQGLTEVFNLQWTADEEQKIVYCEPYNDFFGSGEVLDWSDKLDYKSWNDQFIIEKLAKEVSFQYKEDTGDKLSDQVYRWDERQGNVIEQSHVEYNEDKFRKELLEMGTDIFSTTIQFNAYGKQPTPGQHGNGDWGWGDLTWTDPQNNRDNPLMPGIWHEHGHINKQTRPDFNMNKPKFDMRLLNYYGKTDCAPYQFLDSGGYINHKTKYPHLGWINWWDKGVQIDPYNLSWSDEDDGYGNVSPGLFTKYWRVAYLKMNGGSALRTCKMKLTADDIAQFDYRDLILIKIDSVDTYWTINKIKDYQPNKNELTTVELIEWKQAKDFGLTSDDRQRGRLSNIDFPNDRGSIVSQSNDEGLVLRNNTQNNSMGTGIAFGNGVVAQNNQTVLGNYNKPNNTDILQVGSGLNQANRTTALTIKNSGEVEIHGGEINVEETDGIIHDLVYTDKDGNIQKLYLKKE